MPNIGPNVTGHAGDVVSTSQASSTLRETRSGEVHVSSPGAQREAAVTHLARPAETDFAKDDAATMRQGRDDDATVVDQTHFSPLEPSPRQPGVIRVGEARDQIDVNKNPETDLLTEKLPGMAATMSSIPRDYLAGIRDWLNSPPVSVAKNEGLQTSKADPPAIVATVKELDQRAVARPAEPAVPAQNEIQEFSLSIGNISIVVEEPPAAKQPVTVAPTSTSAPVNSSPQKHDAFALTRSYFRGF